MKFKTTKQDILQNRTLLNEALKEHSETIKMVNERGYNLQAYDNLELTTILSAFEDIAYYSKLLVDSLRNF